MASINVELTGIENVLALINAANPSLPSPVTTENVGLSIPIVRVPDANPRNTSVEIGGVEGQGYSGNLTLTYTRPGIGTQVVTPPTTVNVQAGTSQATFKTQLAGIFNLVESEFTVSDLPTPGTTGTVTIAAYGQSYLYTGEYSFNVSVAPNDIGDSLTNPDLDGFDEA